MLLNILTGSPKVTMKQQHVTRCCMMTCRGRFGGCGKRVVLTWKVRALSFHSYAAISLSITGHISVTLRTQTSRSEKLERFDAGPYWKFLLALRAVSLGLRNLCHFHVARRMGWTQEKQKGIERPSHISPQETFFLHNYVFHPHSSHEMGRKGLPQSF